MVRIATLTLVPGSVFILLLGTETGAIKCLKDEELGEYPVNVYYCDDTSRPLCCQDDGQFTCCATQSARTIKEQLQIWGSVLAISLVVAVVWICYRTDNHLCDEENLKQWCMKRCRKRYGKNAVGEESAAKYSTNESRLLKEPGLKSNAVQWRAPVIAVENIDDAMNDDTADVDSGRGSVTSTEAPSYAQNRRQ